MDKLITEPPTIKGVKFRLIKATSNKSLTNSKMRNMIENEILKIKISRLIEI